jgi:hypothetical protein
VEERFEPRILESFGPVTQEQLPASHATIHTQEPEEKSKLDESSRDSLACTTWFKYLGKAGSTDAKQDARDEKSQAMSSRAEIQSSEAEY